MKRYYATECRPFVQSPQAGHPESYPRIILAPELGRLPVLLNRQSSYKNMRHAEDHRTIIRHTMRPLIKKAPMNSEELLASAILKEIRRVYLCTTPELCALLPQFSPGEIIANVERLIQEGAIAFRSSDPSHLILWLPPTRSAKRATQNPIETAAQNSDSVGLEHGSLTEATSSLTHL